MHADPIAPTHRRQRPAAVDDPIAPELRHLLDQLGPRELVRQVELLVR